MGNDQLILEGLTGLHLLTKLPGSGVHVNYYFARAFEDLWDAGLAANLAELAAQFPDYQLWVTGHSLGAALASLGAVEAVRNNLWSAERTVHYVFGWVSTTENCQRP